MSLGYAEKLSYREDVGTVGMSEIFDPPDVLDEKIAELAELIQKSKHLVAFTGAGISTSCGIPDFRGPKGVWTLQNVDSLHLRSGIPREKLAELHGNSFREICPSCGAEYVRDFEIETIGMKETSRRCSNLKCGARLSDTVLDWEDALQCEEMDPAEEHCRKADVVLCLGTSLQITPACNLPLKSIRGGGKMVIVNLQKTPKDNKASLVIRGRVDKVIAGVMHFLNLRIPPYICIDFVHISFSHASKRKAYLKWVLRIRSIHGPRAPLSFLHSIEVSFPERPDLKTALLQKQPFRLARQTTRRKSFKMLLKFNLIDGCGCSSSTVEWPVNFSVKKHAVTHDKNEVVRKLRDAAEQESTCGQNAIVERTVTPNSESCTIVIATNSRSYDCSVEDMKPTAITSSSNGLAIKRRNAPESGNKMPSKKSKAS